MAHLLRRNPVNETFSRHAPFLLKSTAYDSLKQVKCKLSHNFVTFYLANFRSFGYADANTWTFGEVL